jgi:hypothetical protein
LGRKAIYANAAERTAAYRARKAELVTPKPPTATPWADLPRPRRLQVLLVALLQEVEAWKDDLSAPLQQGSRLPEKFAHASKAITDIIEEIDRIEGKK